MTKNPKTGFFSGLANWTSGPLLLLAATLVLRLFSGKGDAWDLGDVWFAVVALAAWLRWANAREINALQEALGELNRSLVRGDHSKLDL